MPIRLRAVVVASLAVLSLAGCGGTSGTISPAKTTPGAVQGPVVGPVAPSAGAAAQEPEQSGVATFGQRYTWPDGLAVEVPKPAAFKPSASAAGNTEGRAVLVSVTVVNGTSKPYDFNSFLIGPQATFSGEQATTITDIEKKVGVASGTTILPGKSFKYQVGYSIPKAAGELQLEFGDGLQLDKAIFTGNV